MNAERANNTEKKAQQLYEKLYVAAKKSKTKVSSFECAMEKVIGKPCERELNARFDERTLVAWLPKCPENGNSRSKQRNQGSTLHALDLETHIKDISSIQEVLDLIKPISFKSIKSVEQGKYFS